MRPARAGDAPHPCLILLHGFGGSESDYAALAPRLDPRLVVVTARGPFAHRDGGYAWFDFDVHGPALGSEGIEASLSRLEALLGEVVERYAVDPAQLYVGGFSQGGAMAGAVALLHPDRVAGAIVLGGFLPPDLTGTRYRGAATQGLPVFQGHGRDDVVVDIDYARRTRDALRAARVDLTYIEYPAGHWITDEELRDVAVWLRRTMVAASSPDHAR